MILKDNSNKPEENRVETQKKIEEKASKKKSWDDSELTLAERQNKKLWFVSVVVLLVLYCISAAMLVTRAFSDFRLEGRETEIEFYSGLLLTSLFIGLIIPLFKSTISTNKRVVISLLIMVIWFIFFTFFVVNGSIDIIYWPSLVLFVPMAFFQVILFKMASNQKRESKK